MTCQEFEVTLCAATFESGGREHDGIDTWVLLKCGGNEYSLGVVERRGKSVVCGPAELPGPTFDGRLPPDDLAAVRKLVGNAGWLIARLLLGHEA